MFVPCPHCGFLVALLVKDGDATRRCPRCNGVLQLDPPAADADATVDPTAIDTPPDEAEPGTDPMSTEDIGGASPEAAPDTAAPRATGTPPADRVSPPSPARRGAGGPSFARVRIDTLSLGPRWPALLAVAGLTLLLILQLLLAQRAELAAQARWRPLLIGVCTVLRCELPPWHEPEAYTMLDRSVRPVPGQAGLLRVNASFRNDARWAQAWPTLVLSLSDVDGRQVGQRAFAPDEYRSAHAPDDALAPGQSTTVGFEVVEPAAHIVAFTFDFR